jgi:hypothetical protein
MSKHERTVEQEIEELYRAHYRLASSGWVGGKNRITVTPGDEPGGRRPERQSLAPQARLVGNQP